MKIKAIYFLFIVMIFSLELKAQEIAKPLFSPHGKNDTIAVAGTNENGFMVPWINLQEVTITANRIFKSQAERLAYNRLKYNVLKVMPYALYAKRRYANLERELALTGDKKEQHRLVKQCDKEIKDLFNTEIKELTISQGQILTKLIDRELGRTTFDIVKQNKGGFVAFSYQLIARVVGHNLKSSYDPQQERDIESIIRSAGYYTSVNE